MLYTCEAAPEGFLVLSLLLLRLRGLPQRDCLSCCELSVCCRLVFGAERTIIAVTVIELGWSLTTRLGAAGAAAAAAAGFCGVRLAFASSFAKRAHALNSAW